MYLRPSMKVATSTELEHESGSECLTYDHIAPFVWGAPHKLLPLRPASSVPAECKAFRGVAFLWVHWGHCTIEVGAL